MKTHSSGCRRTRQRLVLRMRGLNSHKLSLKHCLSFLKIKKVFSAEERGDVSSLLSSSAAVSPSPSHPLPRWLHAALWAKITRLPSLQPWRILLVNSDSTEKKKKVNTARRFCFFHCFFVFILLLLLFSHFGSSHRNGFVINNPAAKKAFVWIERIDLLIKSVSIFLWIQWKIKKINTATCVSKPLSPGHHYVSVAFFAFLAATSGLLVVF